MARINFIDLFSLRKVTTIRNGEKYSLGLGGMPKVKVEKAPLFKAFEPYKKIRRDPSFQIVHCVSFPPLMSVWVDDSILQCRLGRWTAYVRRKCHLRTSGGKTVPTSFHNELALYLRDDEDFVLLNMYGLFDPDIVSFNHRPQQGG